MRNLRRLVIALGLAAGSFYPFIGVILVSRGFGAIGVGIVGALGALTFTITVPAWGHLADVHFGRPRTLVVCALGAAAIVLALNLALPLVAIGALFVVLWIFQSGFSPLIDAISLTSLPDPRDYGRLRPLTSLAFATVAITAGFVYDLTGYGVAYWLYPLLLLGLAASASRVSDVGRADLHALAALMETTRTPELEKTYQSIDGVPAVAVGSSAARRAARRTRIRPTWRFGSVGVALRMAPGIVSVLAAVFLVQLGMIASATFLPLRLVALGGRPSDVALLTGLGSAAEIPAMLASGAVVARLGLRGLFAASAVIYATCLASYVVLDAPPLIVATRVLSGAAFAGLIVSGVVSISTLLPRDLQATGQALYQTTAFGAASFVANLVGGVIYASFGVVVFGIGAVLVLAGAVVGWLALPVSITSIGDSSDVSTRAVVRAGTQSGSG